MTDQEFIVTLTRYFIKTNIRRIDFIALTAKTELIILATLLDYPVTFKKKTPSFSHLWESLGNYSKDLMEQYIILQVFKDYMLHNGGLNA